MNDAKAIHVAEPEARHNRYALTDYKNLPAIVRGFIALHQGPATETMAIREAGFMPSLYARHAGRACQIVMVSSLGDVGIRFTQSPDGYGYAERLSIYDLSDYSLERPVDLPDAPPEPVYLGETPLYMNRKARRKRP